MDRLRVGYCRVSTLSDEQQQALPLQRARIEAEAPDLILADSESGLNADRPSYQELRRIVAAGTVAEVIATEFSRLGRDAREADSFVALCDANATTCRTLADGVLTMATPEGLLLTRLAGSLSQGESMRLSARVKRGYQQGRQQGRPMRRPCWAYRLNADHSKLEPDPDAWPLAQRLLTALRSNNWRVHTTLQTFPEPLPFASSRSLRGWLVNPTLRGGVNYRASGITHWDQHEPLITHDEYRQVEVVIQSNRRRWGANSTLQVRALTSLCRCAHCGWRCCYFSNRVHPAIHCNNDRCSRHTRGTREALVIRWAFEQIAAQAAHHLAAAATQQEPPEAGELRRQILQLERLGDPDLAAAIKQKHQRLELLLAQPVADASILEAVADPEWHLAATYDQQTAMLQQLVREIQVQDQQPVAIALRL